MENETEISKQNPESKPNQTDISYVDMELPDDRTHMAKVRTDMADERTQLARDRTHMANERTFQSWIRTSLALIGFGFVIERFMIYLKRGGEFMNMPTPPPESLNSLWVGAGLICLGVLIIILAFFRYKRTASKIGTNRYTSSNWLYTMMVLAIVTGGVIILFDLLFHL